MDSTQFTAEESEGLRQMVEQWISEEFPGSHSELAHAIYAKLGIAAPAPEPPPIGLSDDEVAIELEKLADHVRASGG